MEDGDTGNCIDSDSDADSNGHSELYTRALTLRK
jgi:hypothetical protein